MHMQGLRDILTRYSILVDIGLFLLGAAIYVSLYQAHLRNIPFFDEWLYLNELGKLDYSVWWVFDPAQEHFFPINKLYQYLLYVWAGDDFVAYKKLTFLLYIGVAVALYYYMRRLGVSFVTRAFLFLLILATSSFAEITAWSANSPRLLFALFLFLFLHQSENYLEHASTRSLALAASGFLLMQYSFVNPLFSIFILIIYMMTRMASIREKRQYAVVLGAVGAISLFVYWIFVHHKVNEDYARVNAFSDTASKLVVSIIDTPSIFVQGIGLPFFGIFGIDVSAHKPWVFVAFLLMAGIGFGVYIIRNQYRNRKMELVVALTAIILFIILSSRYYRGSYEFVLTWNRYQYIAGLLFWVIAGLGISAIWLRANRPAKAVVLVLMAIVLTSHIRQSDRILDNYLAVFVRDAWTKRMVTDTRRTFSQVAAEQEGQDGLVLYDGTFKSSHFVPGHAPTLSNVLFLIKKTRPLEIEFLANLDDNRIGSAKETLSSNKRLRSYYVKYFPDDAAALGVKP